MLRTSDQVVNYPTSTIDTMATATRTQQTRWLDASQQRAWRSFLGGQTVLFDSLDRDLRSRHDLSLPEYEILVRLSEAPRTTLRMAELASSLAHSRSRITHTISRLQRAGLVEREACESDGRGVNARLTTDGLAMLEAASHTHVAGVREYLLDHATSEEFDVIGRVFERVVTALDGERF